MIDHTPLRWSSFSKLLLIALGLSIAVVIAESRWEYLFGDRSNDEVVQLTKGKLLSEVATDESLQQAISGKNLNTVDIVFTSAITNPSDISFHQQIQNLAPRLANAIYQRQMPYILYFDIDESKVAHLESPRLIFYGVNGQWSIYFDDRKIDDLLTSSDEHFSYALKQNGVVPKRITFHITPDKLHALDHGIKPTYGLSARSASESTIVTLWVANRARLMRLLVYLSLVMMFKSMFTLYISNVPREYRDVFAFAMTSALISILVLIRIPFFTDSFHENPELLDTINLSIFALTCLAVTYLSASFLRLENDRQVNIKALLWTFTAWCVGIKMTYFASWGGGFWTTYAWLSVSTIITNIAIFIIGVRRVLQYRQTNTSSGYPELNAALPRRFAEIGLFALGTMGMYYTYGWGIFMTNISYGSDYWMMVGLIPMTVIYYQLQMMVSRSTRESKQLRGQLSVLERLVATDNKDVYSRQWKALIAAFDVKGFTTMQFLETLSPQVRVELSGFIKEVGDFFDKLLRDSPHFHKKNIGDEWIFLLRPEDVSEEGFEKLFRSVFFKFRNTIDAQVSHWKLELQHRLSGKIPDELNQFLVQRFAIHSCLIIVDDLKIDNGKGQSEKGDFKSPTYSLIKGIEKYSSHWAVAMKEDQSRLIGGDLIFAPTDTKIHSELQKFVDRELIPSSSLPTFGLLIDPAAMPSDHLFSSSVHISSQLKIVR